MAKVGKFTDDDGTEITVAVYGNLICLEVNEACVASLAPSDIAELRGLLDIAESRWSA